MTSSLWPGAGVCRRLGAIREDLIVHFLRTQRGFIALVVGTLALGTVLFPLLFGLNSVVGMVLAMLVAAVAVGVYRVSSGGSFEWQRPWKVGRLLVSWGLSILIVGLAIQLVPYGRAHANPAVTAEPAWDSQRTRELTVRACFDCHSNEVVYPWYASVAPVSWAVEFHVAEGRGKVNYSEWDQPQREADESAEVAREGEMPPAYYTRFTHPDARLTDAEMAELVAGLEATFGSG